MPKGMNEIVLSEDLMNILDIREPYIGKSVTLEYSTDNNENDNTKERTTKIFTVVGWYCDERLYDINKEGIIYTSEKFAKENGKSAENDGCVYFSLKKNNLVKEFQIILKIFNLTKVTSSDEHSIDRLVKDLSMDADQSIKKIYNSPVYVYDAFGDLTSYLLVIIPVIICGFLLIFDCFYLSISRDIRDCGLLMAVGASLKQLRSIIRRQAVILAVIGIAIGLLLSILTSCYTVPVFLKSVYVIEKKIYFMWTFSSFLLAALLTFMTVIAGSRAVELYLGRISIIESIRFESAAKRKKLLRKISGFYSFNRHQTLRGEKIYQMAVSNVMRNAKVNFHVMLSLSIAVVVFLLINIMISGINPKDFASYRLENHDFVLYNETFSGDYVDPESPYTTGTPGNVFDDDFVSNLKKQENLKYFNTVGYLPVAIKMDMNALGKYIDYHYKVNGQGKQYKQGSFEIGDLWVAETDYLLEHLDVKQRNGIDLTKLEKSQALVLSIYPERTDLFPENFAMEGYVLNTDQVREYYRSNQTADLKLLLDLSGNKDSFSYVKGGFYPPTLDNVAPLTVAPPALYVNNSAVKDFSRSPILYKIEIDTDTAHRLGMETYLKEAISNNPLIHIESKDQLIATMEAYKNSVYLFGYMLAIIIALIGILGFINMTVINTKLRKHEFAVLRSIGMTKKQLYQMLITEGLFCSLILIFSILTVGNFIVCKIYQIIKTVYQSFHYPVIPLIVACSIIIVLLSAIPLIAYSLENRKSISQTLQEIK